MKIEIGDFVKVRSHGERFWCEVLGKDDAGVLVRVNNHLLCAPYKFGEAISIEEKDILDLMPGRVEGEK